MPPKAFAGRYISVYLDTREEKTFWEEKAKEHGTTLSKLVFEGLETLRTRIESKPRPDLLKENELLKPTFRTFNPSRNNFRIPGLAALE